MLQILSQLFLEWSVNDDIKHIFYLTPANNKKQGALCFVLFLV